MEKSRLGSEKGSCGIGTVGGCGRKKGWLYPSQVCVKFAPTLLILTTGSFSFSENFLLRILFLLSRTGKKFWNKM